MWVQIFTIFVALPLTLAAQTPLACYNKAQNKTLLTNEQAITLCRCATSTAPVDCYTEATRSTTLQPEQVLELCVGSAVYGPDCYYWEPYKIR